MDGLGIAGYVVAGMFYSYSLELDDHNNAPEKSCIPYGKYLCEVKDSPKFGRVYEVKNVPGRTDVLIHAGNFAADEGKGKADTNGCILLGNAIGEIAGQKALLSSKDALRRFMSEMNGEAFTLFIERKKAA